MDRPIQFEIRQNLNIRFYLSLAFIAGFLLFEPWLTLPMKWAAWCYFLMCVGIFLRKKSRKMHAIFMGSAVLGDLALVLILQFQRGAVQTALKFSLSLFQQAHIGFSTLATALYIPLLILGWNQLKASAPNLERKKWHGRLGILAFLLRTIGFVLMFSMLDLHAGQ